MRSRIGAQASAPATAWKEITAGGALTLRAPVPQSQAPQSQAREWPMPLSEADWCVALSLGRHSPPRQYVTPVSE